MFPVHRAPKIPRHCLATVQRMQENKTSAPAFNCADGAFSIAGRHVHYFGIVHTLQNFTEYGKKGGGLLMFSFRTDDGFARQLSEHIS